MSKKFSAEIRERLVKANASFFANDTIHNFVSKDEMKLLEAEVASNVKTLLESLVIDVDNDHNTNDTHTRIAKNFLYEVFRGRYSAPPKVTKFPNFKKLDEFYTVGPISVRSTCSHHFAPILGKVWIGLVAEETLMGLSKFSRIVDWVMSKPQIQEEAIMNLANYLEETLSPAGLIIAFKAKHMCMVWRGVKEHETEMSNIVSRGTFSNQNMKDRFLQLISL